MKTDWTLQAAVEKAPEDIEPLRALLAAGHEPDSRSYHGRTPLCELVWRGCVPAVVLLLEHGADPNAVDGKGMSVLTHALYSGFAKRPGVLPAVAALLEAGASPDGHGSEASFPRPLALAVLQRQPPMVELLMRAGAKPTALGPNRRSVLEIAILSGDESYIALLAGPAALDVARGRLPDPEIDVLRARILRLLREENYKFSIVRPGFKYEYDNPTEILWHREMWVEVEEDGYTRSRTVRRGFVADDSELLDYLVRERGGWEGRTVPRDQLSNVLEWIVPRGPGDLRLRKKRGRIRRALR